MTYEEMKNQATLFNEMLEIITKKPRLIAESELKIKDLKQEIEGLESDNAQEMMNKLNPKKFIFKKTPPVDIDELILKKEIEIRKEEKNIEVLDDVNTIDLIDLDAVAKEANSIIDKQEKVLKELEERVLKARDEYHRLIDEYRDEYTSQEDFANVVRNKIHAIRKEAYVPKYVGDNSYVTHGEKIKSISLSDDITRGHRRRAMDTQ